MNPGWVAKTGVSGSMPPFYKWMKNRLRTPSQGAGTIVYLALTQSLYPSGELWFDRKIAPKHLIKKTKKSKYQLEDLLTQIEKDIRL